MLNLSTDKFVDLSNIERSVESSLLLCVRNIWIVKTNLISTKFIRILYKSDPEIFGVKYIFVRNFKKIKI